MDRFSPEPEYFGEEENSERYSGNAEIISKYFGTPKESIEKYLIGWTDEHYEEGDILLMKMMNLPTPIVGKWRILWISWDFLMGGKSYGQIL